MKNKIIAFIVSCSLIIGFSGTGAGSIAAKAVKPAKASISTAAKMAQVRRPFAQRIKSAAKYKTFTPKYRAANTADGSTDYGYSKLDANERKAYALLKQAAQTKSVGMSINVANLNLSLDKMKYVFNSFVYDNPQFFWLSLGWQYLQDGNIIDCVIIHSIYENSDGSIDAATVAGIQKKIDNATAVYLQAVKNVSDPYKKELILHDMLVNNISYDYNGLSTNRDYDYTIDGPLDEKTAVCEGYARTFEYLLNLCGIECIVVTGEGHGDSHAWNIVNLDGEYYEVDSTWDDLDGLQQSGEISHMYFNVTDSKMNIAHTADSAPDLYPLPACDATKDNYYVRSGSYYTSTDNLDSKMVSNIADSIKSGSSRVEFAAADSSVLYEIEDQLSNGGNDIDSIKSGVSGLLDDSKKPSGNWSYGNDTDLNVFIIYANRTSGSTDKTVLSDEITYANLYYANGIKFSSASYGTLQSALSTAQSVNQNQSASQDETDSAAASIAKAINNLTIYYGTGYTLCADSKYAEQGSSKTFSVTVSARDGAPTLSDEKVMVVTVLPSGTQKIGFYPVIGTTPITVSVDETAVQSAVYLINGTFTGQSTPKTYALTQFVS